ncbi:MAG: hypothetical protein IKI04_00580 [Bacilli bacterium]|nr:hypothetical protein [Bacilli bacterium]
MKSKKQVLIIIILLIGLVIIGSTYAFWTWTSNTSKNVIINTSDDLKNYVIYNEGESKFSGSFEVSNSYNDGIYSTISLYKASEVANVDLNAIIHMNINEIGTNMATSSALKWVVTSGTSSNSGSILSQGNFINVNNGDVLTLVPNIEVTTTETFYTVWIWLDENENPSDSLTGETLDVNVWTEINQYEGTENRFEITQLITSYQLIKSIIINNKNNIISYNVTTTEVEPSTWINIPNNEQNNIYNFSYSVQNTGTYYIWFKDSNNNITHEMVTITNVDSTPPVCSWGNFSSSTIANGETSTITLTCTDSESSVIGNITASDINISSNAISISNFVKETITNGYKYTLTLIGNNDNTATLTLDGNKFHNEGGLENASVTSSAITVATPLVLTIYYNNNATSGGTTIASFTDSCLPSSGSCSISIPSTVKNSVGTYNNSYVGLSASTGNMTAAVNSSATSVTLNNNKTYYAIYRTNLTNYYYDSSYTSRTLYRNQWFTSNSAMATTVLSTSSTGTSNYSTAVGPGSSVWSGLSTGADTTAEYASVANAAASNSTSLYTVYQFNITYTKSTNVSDIGTTSASCKVTSSNTSCTVTLPTITADTGYTVQGWYTDGGGTGTKVGNASANYSVSTNALTLYAFAEDVTGPTGSVSASLSTATVSATANFTDAGYGLATVDTYGWKISTSSTCNSSTTGFVTNSNSTYSFTLTADGVYYVCVRAKDIVGNYGYAVSGSIDYNTSPYNSYSCANGSSGSSPYIMTYTGNCSMSGDQTNWKVKFTSGGTLTFSASKAIDAFLVGGGGGGGAGAGNGIAGGGGGGYTTSKANIPLSKGTAYTITIGTGGKGGGGGGSGGSGGANGGTTSAFNVSANGGKGGYASSAAYGGAGGSGGGGSTGTSGGYGGSNGGSGSPNGGAGQGTSTREFWTIDQNTSATLYAGGGGCGGFASGGAGGSGGGGAGKGQGSQGGGTGSFYGYAGTANTGGGGGSGYTGGGAGGSGIVVIRATTTSFQSQTLNSGTIYTAYTSNSFTGAANNSSDYTYTIKSGAPTGATINSTNRTISFPNTTNAARYYVVVTATNSTTGATIDATMTIDINLVDNPLYSYSCANASAGSAPYMLTYTGNCSMSGDATGWKAKLLNNGTLSVNKALNIDAFLVGGGGGGGGPSGNAICGGGGGGYTNSVANLSLELNTDYAITIGAGGAGGTSGSNNGKTGGTTSAFGSTAAGGTGGTNPSGQAVGGNGGSGGGGATGTSGGYGGSNGGSGSPNGGTGQGTSTREFWTIDQSTSATMYAGGGGCGGYASGGAGGEGGGGAGKGQGSQAGGTGTFYGYPGTANTGGGGGSGYTGGGAGGTGVVVIRNKRG